MNSKQQEFKDKLIHLCKEYEMVPVSEVAASGEWYRVGYFICDKSEKYSESDYIEHMERLQELE